VQPFNHGKSIKKECNASPKRDEHSKGGGETFPLIRLVQRTSLKGMKSISTPMFSSIMRIMAMKKKIVVCISLYVLWIK
jgi:hypothetical protein